MARRGVFRVLYGSRRRGRRRLPSSLKPTTSVSCRRARAPRRRSNVGSILGGPSRFGRRNEGNRILRITSARAVTVTMCGSFDTARPSLPVARVRRGTVQSCRHSCGVRTPAGRGRSLIITSVPLGSPLAPAKAARRVRRAALVTADLTELTERATGLEPATSSLGSGTKLTGALRNSPRISAVRPACFSRRQDISWCRGTTTQSSTGSRRTAALFPIRTLRHTFSRTGSVKAPPH
jgi:hypothetical protein